MIHKHNSFIQISFQLSTDSKQLTFQSNPADSVLGRAIPLQRFLNLSIAGQFHSHFIRPFIHLIIINGTQRKITKQQFRKKLTIQQANRKIEIEILNNYMLKKLKILKSIDVT